MKKLLLVICAMLSLNVLTAQKNVLLEEITGTWCNNCPSGIYYIDSLHHTYDNVIAIAVHTDWPTQKDPMSYQEYAEKTKLTSAPSANIGRRYTAKNTSEWFQFVEEEMNQQPKANVSVATSFDEESRLLTAVITVTAIENLEGSYTVSGVVCEDAVTGTSAAYNQANVYAQYAYYPMGGFENMPDPIPANRIAYDHVARQLLGTYEGEGGLTPLAKDQSFAQTFTYYIPEGYDHNYIRVVGMLLDGSGMVDNAGISDYANGKTNAAPKFTSSPVVSIPAGVEYIYNVYAHDTDDRNIVISVEQKPEWLTFEQKGKSAVVKGTATEPGVYTVVLKVSDGEDETLQEYEITVLESLNANWETLGERAFSQVGYGFIFGTCSYAGDIYTFLYESGLPVLYKYSTKDRSWKKESTVMDEMGYDGDIAAGKDGIYVTYTLKSNNLIKVKRYANGEWSDVGEIGKLGSVPKIAVDAQNSVFVSFNDANENNRYYLNRYKNGNWETMGVSYISSGGGSWARLALDSKGVPYVSWVDFFAGQKMYVSKLVGEIWLAIGDEPVSHENLISKNCQDLAIDADGNVYIAYCVKGTDQLAVYRHNGSEWELLGDNIADGTVKGIDVAIDSEQNFYVAYADGGSEDKVSVVKYNGTEWSYVGQRGFTESKTDSYMAMTLHNDSPCVVYTDVAMGSKASAKYYKISNYLYPPVGLTARVIGGDDVELTWQAPLAEPSKYNIYRNDALVGNTAQVSYIDEDLESGTYNYAVSAVYEDGESEKATATVNFTVSISENNEIAFMMYPNPAENYVTIESAKAADVKIYSISGQMLSQQNISEGTSTIDLSDLNAGIYFVSVNGTMVKVVKK